MPRRTNNYDSDNDTEYLDYQEKEQQLLLNQIQQFTIDDYLSCKETRNILTMKWEHIFEERLQDQIEYMYTEFLSSMKGGGYNILALADDIHSIDLVSMICHHIDKKYSLEIFQENSNLAQALVERQSLLSKR